MSEDSAIEWTDATWNPVRGCLKVSPGCKNCYAETFAERFRGVEGHPYEQGFDPRTVPEMLDRPLQWQKPRMIFVNSMSDLFGEFVENEYIASVFAVMASANWHTYQVLTKRADRLPEWFDWVQRDAEKAIESYLSSPLSHAARCARAAMVPPMAEPARPTPELRRIYDAGSPIFDAHFKRSLPERHWMPWPLPHVWLGVSVEDRRFGLPRIEKLREVPAAVRFLSIEPLLEDLGELDLRGIHWVIVGGESGPCARPMHPDWVRSIRDQCAAAKVPFFFKQWGGVNKKLAGRTLDGRTWDEMPRKVAA